MIQYINKDDIVAEIKELEDEAKYTHQIFTVVDYPFVRN
jgi:hypothetical protein